MRRPAQRRASADDIVGRDAADRGGPGGVLRLAVVAAEEIALEGLPADAVPVEEGAVVQPFGHQRVGEAEHQRDIGAGADRLPLRVDLGRQVVAHRADQVKLDAAPARRGEPVARDVLAGAAAADIAVLQRHAAEGEHERALARPARPS